MKNPPPPSPPKPAAAPQNTAPAPPPPVAPQIGKEELHYYQTAMQATDLNKVVSNLTKAIEINPNYMEAIFYRGVANYQNKNPNKAIPDFDKLIKMNAKHFGAFTYRGRAKESLKLFTDALNDYNTALKINPKFGEGYFYRGLYYKNSGNDADKACKDLKEAKKLGYNVSDENLKDCK